ncbi:MAG: hypothetical protein QM710_02685 [Flavobacterium sp.]
MNSSILVMLVVTIALAFIANAIFHFYFKQKHLAFMQELEGRDYCLSKEADIEMDFTSRFSLKYHYYTGDVIFSKNGIYLLKRRRYGFGQCAPISVLTNGGANLGLQNLAHFHFYDKLSLIKGRLVIETPKNGNFNAKVKANIKLTDNTDIPMLIEKFDLNPKS